MRAELERLRLGQITFDEFARRTRSNRMQMARYLLKKWAAPLGVGLEDVEQELLVAIWQFLPKWDPTRGVGLERYIVFNAIDRAKKWLHKQRNAYRRDDKSAGRYERAFSTLVRDGQDDAEGESYERLVEKLLAVAPDVERLADRQERELEELEALAVATERLTERDRYLVMALAEAGGDVELAAREVYADARSRLVLRLDSEASTRAAVRRALARAAA